MPAKMSLPLQTLLGIPLADLVEGERAAAQASAAFIRDVGFTGDGQNGDDFGALRYITFRYETEGPGGKPVPRWVRVPLLSLLPLPLLQLSKAEFEFAVRVEDIKDMATKEGAHVKPRVAAAGAQPRYDIVACIDTTEPQPQMPRIRVRLEVTPSDLPAGIAGVLRKLDQAVQESSRGSE